MGPNTQYRLRRAKNRLSQAIWTVVFNNDANLLSFQPKFYLAPNDLNFRCIARVIYFF
jgi:hypothetical protein